MYSWLREAGFGAPRRIRIPLPRAGHVRGQQDRYCTIQIKAGQQTLIPADHLPDDLRAALTKINSTTCTNLAKSSLGFMRCLSCWFYSPGM